MRREKILAWCVHCYTALGLLCAARIVVLIVRGGDASFREAFALMLLATVIDSTDGWLARRARVKQVLPGFNGRRLDDLVDFINYTTLPLLLLWRAGIPGGGMSGWLLVPLFASAYGFSQENVKTEDGYFLGFPSYWNVVALYLYLLRPPEWLSLAVIIVLALLTFVPARYLYPSQKGAPLGRLTILLCAAWAALLLVIIMKVSGDSPSLLMLSLIFPAYYMLLSWAITLKLLRR